MCKFLSKFLSLLVVFTLPGAGAERHWSGTPEIEQALQALNVLGGVLMIAAHPDDENTAVLAYFARGRHMRTAYLSATRGEGGQNLIGPEQGDLLGVIRTQELLAARRIDGAGQFFTRAIDFGFTKSADETIARWGRERTVSDMTWVIRTFRPDVILLRFSGTPRDGHGQHQASAWLAREAFAAAGDATRFPEQLKFVRPWQPRRLLWNSFSFTAEQEREAARMPHRVEIDTGAFNPVLGRSYNEIAGMSRSQHRSQGMGSPERRGPSRNYFVHVAGEPAARDLFDGIDTTWNRVPGGAPIAALLGEALRTFRPGHPEEAVPLLLEARPLVAAIRDPWGAVKLKELDEAIALCSGLWLAADASRWDVVPGSTVDVRLTALNRSPVPLRLVRVELNGKTETASQPLADNQPLIRTMQVEIAGDQPYSQPFWLARPNNGSYYEIDRQSDIGVPENPPVLSARFVLEAGGAEFALERAVQYRYVDHVVGEQTRPLAVVPKVALNVPEEVVVFPSATPKPLRVEVLANAAQPAAPLRPEAPDGWEASAAGYPALAAGERREVQLELKPPAGDSVARLQLDSAFGMRVISYPHIPPQVVFPPAETRLVRVDVRVTARRVGYIMGAGDRMPEALRQMGCEVVLLPAGDVEHGDLTSFDAIVAGVRAYNTRADLRANHARLMQYVEGGGTYIVQYNVLDNTLRGDIGPYPITIGRGRVSVEEAPVEFVDADSPLLRAPNAITARDFEGWIQERGLYFASRWDPRYKTVLASHDPGEKPLAGGELWTRYGKGVYIFTAYSWFRELPAGVPGAFRLFANRLSAK